MQSLKRIALIGACISLLGAAVQLAIPKDLRRFWQVYAPPLLSPTPPPAGTRMAMGVVANGPGRLQEARLLGFSLWRYDMPPFSNPEVAPGQWEWQPLLDSLQQAKQNGFQVAIGVHHVFPPKWYLEREKPAILRCVQHREEIPALSPWEPKFASWLDRQWAALAQHLRANKAPADLLLLSIHGETGEASLMLGGIVPPDEWTRRVGKTLPHKDFWCDDDKARHHFRQAMLRKYGDLHSLNKAWGTQFASEEEIRYPRSPAEGKRWWIDFVSWYQNGVTYLVDVVCRLAQRYFPDSVRLVPIGIPNEDPRYGADISAIVKVAAKHKAGVRSLHLGALPLPQNDSFLLARIASACRFYGAPLWLESPNPHLTTSQHTEALFQAIAHGATGIFNWSESLQQHQNLYLRYLRHLTVGQPIVDVAMFYPTTAVRIADLGEAPTLREGCARARDLFPFDIVDERMVRDGALQRYRILVFWEGTVVEQEVLDAIVEWVKQGGVVVAYDFGKVTNVEGDGTTWRTLFGYAGRLRPWRGAMQGEVPPGGHTLPMDEAYEAGLLRGEWSTLERDGDRLWRWIGNTAQADLWLKAQQTYSLTIRAFLPPESGIRYEVRIAQHRLGYLDSPGETVYKFVIPAAWLNHDGAYPLIFRASEGNAPRCRIAQIQAHALDVSVPPLKGIPSVRYTYTLDPQTLSKDWVQRMGKGLCVFVPVRRAQDGLSAYLQVLRRLVYRLSEIEPTLPSAPYIDDSADGVYTALLADRLLLYNSTPRTTTIQLNLTREMWRSYPQITNPPTGSLRLPVPAQSMAIVPFTKPLREFILQCEGFTDLRGHPRRAIASCSPGNGETCVWIPPGKSIRTRFPVAEADTYQIFVRCVSAERLVAPTLIVGNQRLRVEAYPTLPGIDALRSQAIPLSKGVHTLEIQAPADTGCLADFVILNNDLSIVGYRFASK